jgi:ribosome-binding protein aMBF1 (putative translation factor)
MEFYEELKAARIKAGLTQQQIADEIGITKSTYCGYETAKRNPDPQRIKQLAKVLHISADTLLDTGIEKEKAPASAEAETRENKQVTREDLLEVLQKLHIIESGSAAISDADLQFLMHIIAVIDDWFSNRG